MGYIMQSLVENKHTWNVKRRDGVVLFSLSGFVLRYVSVLNLYLPVNYLCLHSIGGLDQLLALSGERNLVKGHEGGKEMLLRLYWNIEG